MMYFPSNDATNVNAILTPLAGFSLPEADVHIAVIVLTDVKPYKYKVLDVSIVPTIVPASSLKF
jgi:hypothetical protein